MRAGAVQLNSTEDTDRNLETADRLVREAASLGAELVVLPEKWSVLGTDEQMTARREPLDGRCISWARSTARELGIDLVAGSIVERIDGREKLGEHERPRRRRRRDPRRVPEAPHVRRRGRRRHVRRVGLEDAGDEVVVSELPGGVPLGMSICYDVRFPELYRDPRRARRAR